MSEIRRVQRDVFICDDGQEFTDLTLAQKHNKRRKLFGILEKSDVYIGGSCTIGDFIEVIDENRAEILEYLGK